MDAEMQSLNATIIFFTVCYLPLYCVQSVICIRSLTLHRAAHACSKLRPTLHAKLCAWAVVHPVASRSTLATDAMSLATATSIKPKLSQSPPIRVKLH